AVVSSTYDNANRLVERSLSTGLGTWADVELTYGPQDQLRHVERWSKSTRTGKALYLAASTNYSYDAVGRLIEQQDTNSIVPGIADVRYGYNAAGLLLTEASTAWDSQKGKVVTAPPVTYKTHKTGQLLNDGQQKAGDTAFDNNGNPRTINGQPAKYYRISGFAPSNRLKSVAGATYVYDAVGNRIAQQKPQPASL